MLNRSLSLLSLSVLSSAALWGCSDSPDDPSPESGDTSPDDEADALGGAGGAGGAPAASSDARGYVVMSITIDADNNRSSYAQVIESLDAGPYDLDDAIEIPGNAEFLAVGDSFFIGEQEQPTWTKYEVDDDLEIEKGETLSLSQFTSQGVGYAHALLDATTALTVVTETGVGVFWDPSTMKITGEVDLSDMIVDDFSWEAWTTSAYDGKIYIPGRYANWDTNTVRDVVRMAIVDAGTQELLGIAEDDRCASAGMPVFDPEGYAYVMGDGRNQITHMVARAQDQEEPENCLLRIAPGETDFEEDFYASIPSLTGGLDSMTELATAVQGSGYALTKMFYPDELPQDVEPVDYAYWSVAAFKFWRIELGDEPSAEVVSGAPFGAVGFTGVPTAERYYVGESPDGVDSVVYEIDPATNTSVRKFEIAGNFSQLHRLD